MPMSRSALDQVRSNTGKTVGEAVIETLIDWGIDTVFGIPGDNLDGLLNGLYKHQDRIRFVLVRHEENAAFMATAYAKLTGRMAACLATGGPGAYHLVNGLSEAYLDRIPLLALVGNTTTSGMGTDQLQEIRPELEFAGCTVWNHSLMSPRNARMLPSNAIRAAYAKSGPALLTLPMDVGLAVLPRDTKLTDCQLSRPTLAPDPMELRRIAQVLDRARKPVLLVGRGCQGAGESVLKLADRLGAPIIKALWGKEVVSDFDPHVLGGLGYLGTRASVEAVMGADLLLMLGTSFPYVEFLPRPGACVTVQIDHDPTQIGKRHPVDLGACADVPLAVGQLLAMCRRHPERGWLESCQAARGEWNALMDRQAHSDRIPMRPQVVARALQDLADDEAILTTDSGANLTWMARNFFVNGRQRFIGSGLLMTMQCALPYAIGAKFACPERQVIACVGDGSFVMGMGEFLTAVQYRLPILVTIFRNGKLSLIKYEEEALGVPEFGVHLHNPDFVKFAEACGAYGARIERPQEARDVLRAAMESGGPAIVEAVVEPNEVPFPPMVQKGQATGFGIAFLREAFARVRE